jgi:hypothetical protein
VFEAPAPEEAAPEAIAAALDVAEPEPAVSTDAPAAEALPGAATVLDQEPADEVAALTTEPAPAADEATPATEAAQDPADGQAG